MATHLLHPEVHINKSFPTAAAIQKHLGSTHGLTLIALSLMDHTNVGLAMELACVGEVQLQDYASQIMGILHKSAVIKVYIRSVKNNGVFQDQFNGAVLEHSSERPASTEEFKNGANVICDVEVTNQGQTLHFWRIPEVAPRVLKLYVK